MTEKNVSQSDYHNDVFDPGNPYSILNMLPEALKTRVLDAQYENPELFDMAEDELKKHIKELTGKYPNSTENQLRLRLWYYYDQAVSLGYEKINITEMCAGLVPQDTIYKYAKQKFGIAWLLCRPLSYEDHLEEMLNFGASEMRKILALDNVQNGKLDTKLIQIKVNLYLAAELRKFGGIPQINKNINYDFGVNRGKTTKTIEEMNEKNIDQAIGKLQMEQKREIKRIKEIEVLQPDSSEEFEV